MLFVIELRTRRVKIAGIHHQPYGEWMEQMARNLADAFDAFQVNASHLIHDRDPLFTDRFREILRSVGIDPVKLPARSPNLNAYAERFVRSIKEECLDRIVPLASGICAFSFRSTSSTAILREITRASITSCSNPIHKAQRLASRSSGASASVDSSTTTIVRRRSGPAD